MSARLLNGDAESDCGVEQAGAVEMDGEAGRAGGGCGRLHLFEGDGLAAVGIFENEEPGDGHVRIVRADCGLDGLGLDGAVRFGGDGLQRDAAEDGGAGGFAGEDVVALGDDDFFAAGAVRQAGGEVGLRARRQEQCAFLAKAFGGFLFKGVDGRVIAVDVVADLGLGHRASHRGIGAGDGVAAQVDQRVGI